MTRAAPAPPPEALAARGPYEVDLERFQGPLDLLLHLIRNQDVDIFDIPIARITEQFLAAIRGAERLELERAGEFLEMAATLIRIKAQMLFPRQGGDDEEDDPRADLVRRLLEYEHFREAARLLERAERERARQWARGWVEVRPSRRLAELPLETEWEDVWAAVVRLGERLAEPETVYRFAGRPVRMDEKLALLGELLERHGRVEYTALVLPWGTRMHAAVALLACLEMAKRNFVRLRQAAPFAALWIYRERGEERSAGDADG